MPDKAIENAMSRREELAAKINEAQQRLEEWRRELARADAFIRDWHVFAGEPIPSEEAADRFVATGTVGGRNRRNSKKEEVARQARELILDRNEPIGRTELYELLTKERGLTIEGTDPEMVLSTMLWRMKDRIVRLKSGGYWLPEKPYEPANYWPDIEDMMEATDSSPHGSLTDDEDNEPGH